MSNPNPLRPATKARAVYISDSIVTNGAYRIVAEYRARVDAHGMTTHADRVEILFNVVSTPALWLTTNPGEAADVRATLAWQSVGYAMFALDMLEVAGSVAPRARWSGDGRYVLGVRIQSARHVLGFYDDETTLNFQLGYLEGVLGKLPEGFASWANHYPTPM